MSETLATPEERLERAEVRLARYRTLGRRVLIGVAIGVVVIVLTLVGFGVWAAGQIDHLQTSNDRLQVSVLTLEAGDVRDRCNAVLQGDYLVAIARALAAPPAPNSERLAAVTDIKNAAARIRDADKVCANGVPAPLTPSPAPPPAP